MTTIGFLACETTLPGSGERRGDAFEHDLEIAAIIPAFEAAGLDLRVIDWRAPVADFAGIDLVLLGTAWDYQDHAEEFTAKLEALEAAGVIVCNSSQIVRWNARKTYLRELAENGAKTIPTLWLDDPDAADIAAAMEKFDCDSLVIKRQIGAGALGQERYTKDTLPPPEWRFGHPAMIQPFLPQIAQEGELSFVIIDGAISHALIKRPAKGDYRIQSLYGGYEEAIEPSAGDVEHALQIAQSLPFDTPLYARIDMLRDETGDLLLMEAELIEPYLYPEQGPALGENLARAIRRRMAAK